MINFVLNFLFLILCIVHSNSDIYRNRPKIKTSDGDLILEAAYDRNIYLKPNGPKSNVFIGNVNLLNINITRNEDIWKPPVDYRDRGKIGDLNDMIRRIERLETVGTTLPSSLSSNITYLTRRINTLSNRVRNLQSLIIRKGRDECQSHPCENGGTCLNLANGYYCLCPTNWKGLNCDEDVNECRNYAGTDLGCQNGATCINTPGSYECICNPGWFGIHCTRKERNCTGNDFEICGHGTCLQVNTGVGVKCLCDQGWTTNDTSIACLTDVNECLSSQGPRCSVNPLVDCINIPGSFVCGHCPAGYEGDGFICRDIDECLTLPNGGCSLTPRVSCYNTIGSRICGPCPPGFEGDGVSCTWKGSCGINGGGCHPLAQCIEIPGFGGQRVQCICPKGMSGDGIGPNGCFIASNEVNSTSCDNYPCGIHGVCHQLYSGYTCICDDGYQGVHCDIATDICFNNPCLNGGTCKSDRRSTRRFRCECTAMFTGDLCQLRVETCGGVLDAEEGSIIYPPTNTTYRPNARCAWVIHTVPDKVINVTFSKFRLEHHAECYYDFVQIHDGRSSASQLIGRFCGSDLPKGGNIISSHNNLYFWFRSDQTISGEGFALHWNSISPICGGSIYATTHGSINSPGSPGSYPPNRDCYWHLNTDLGKRIQLHFFQLDLEIHPNCSFDYLAIYDGIHKTDPLLGKFCNSSQPAPIQSASPEILIHFHSDAYGSGKGFQITYAPIEGMPGCGGLYTAERGELNSPSYNEKYLNNLLCDYKIKTSAETKIQLTFKSFNIEKSFRCKFDYIVIYDGPNEESKQVGKFCGNKIPKTYTSSSNTLFIRFKSDQSISFGGFKITYKSVCQKTIVGDSGIVKSPGYPFKYPKNIICEYIIQTSPGKIIQLTFQDFDIEDNRFYNCQYDYVELRDGLTSNSTLLGKYCGASNHRPPTQTSSFNYLYIGFHSDMSISGTGFFANYTTLDIACGGIYRETTGLINYPDSDKSYYSNDQSCTWFLIAPVGTHIKLTWNRFDIEEYLSCENDFLELIEIDDGNINGTSLGKYCGRSMPPALTTTSNELMVKFQSDSSLNGLGFSFSYSFLDENTNSYCGGIYVKTSGSIHSPGWPNNYEANKDCTWTISVPVGQQVALNIKDFDLERPIREKCDLGDYLVIRDGGSENAPLLAKLCGTIKTKRLISTAHNIYIHFHSDFYISGKGFSIDWDGTLRGCGGTLTSVTGSISSPNYPQNYNDDAECFYKIITSSGSRIQITFIDIDLERSINCRDDYVEIYDGPNVHASSLGKYCKMNSTHTNIETKSNSAFIKFRSDILIGGKGFFLNYKTICNTNITGSYGVIESPGYPDKYPLNYNCLWTITVGLGNKINITFTHFNIYSFLYTTPYTISHWNRYHSSILTQRPPSHPFRFHSQVIHHCESYLQYKEKNEENYSDQYCGTSFPPAITTNSNTLQLHFVSGYFNAASGFRLEWVKDGCGGYLNKRYGTIQLAKNIKYSYSGLECEWNIETPPGTRVTVFLDEILVEETNNCTIDGIEFYNGQSSSSHLITKICHQGLHTIQSTSNFMFVKFLKKSSLREVYFSGRYDSYATGCGGHINTRTGIITSENYPKNYDNNMDCLWYIIVPNNHRIELNFMDLDLYSIDDNEDDCGDSIKIYESTMIMYTNYTHRICPKSNVSQIITNTPYVILQFTSDIFGTAKGFKVNFTTTCGAYIEAKYDGIITNDRFLSQNLKNCTWVVSSSDLGQKIKLTLEHISIPRNLDIVSSKECPSSFIKFFDGNDINAPVIGEYCGYKVPSTIVSHGSALTVMHGTYGTTLGGSFTAHYSTLSSACGGTISSEEGSIASPNYPLSYPLGIDCEWTLQASAGNSMYITFETFNIVYSDRCNEDYLEIRENNGAGRLLGVYCGETLPINTTSGSVLYLKFHSGSESSNTGFLAHFGILHYNEITDKTYGDISSPLYPHTYNREGEFSWRIVGKVASSLTLIINELVIPKRGEVCDSKLIIYDGYDEEAPILESVCGIIKNNDKIINARGSVVYILYIVTKSDIESIFHLTWSQTDFKKGETVNKCGFNETKIISAGQSVSFHSPNYPHDYGDNLLCEWIFEATEGQHLQLSFNDFKLEETPSCYADHVSIYSRALNKEWSTIKDNICLWEHVKEAFEVSQLLKVVLQTDMSMTEKGFIAKVKSKCGGVLNKSSGTIEFSWNDRYFEDNIIRCNWLIKVRPGRTIKINFEHFNITNEHDCNQYVMIRNGESFESPTLGIGKYCGYEHENKESMISSSNAIYVSYVNNIASSEYKKFETFKLRFEEKNIECGSTSVLEDYKKWEVISSPNYPSVPMPYSECVWTFTSSPGEILRVDFIDRFDIDGKDDCKDESLEIHNGASVLAPIIGVYCGTKPGTIKTSSNALYIKYTTMLAEPRNGFKANISIDVCGGTIIAESGEITSPGYPHMLLVPKGSICQWHIISPLKNVIKLYMVDLNLPDPRDACQINVTITETLPGNKTVSTLKEFCSDSLAFSNSAIETSTNEAIITFSLGDPNTYTQISTNKGFKVKFNSSRPSCGGKLTQSEGYLTTPGYPQGTTLRYCLWFIVVPDETRRIKLEIIDYDQNERIGIYNDATFESLIDVYSGQNNSEQSLIYESSGNSIAVYLIMKVTLRNNIHRFKARFTSNEPVLCGGTLGSSGKITAPDLQRSYACKWTYNFGESDNISNSSEYNTVLLSITNTFSPNSKCYYSHSRIIIDVPIENTGQKFTRTVCGNHTEISYRIPVTSLTLKAIQLTHQPLLFNIEWKLQPCGGVIHVSQESRNILNVPKSFNDTLDCGWIVIAPAGVRTEINIQGMFNNDCSDEFIRINQGLTNSLSILEYCNQKVQERSITTSFMHTYIQYHSKAPKSSNLKLIVKVTNSQCGGYLNGYERIFSSPNYPNHYEENIECTWLIQATVGYRVSLSFLQRFVIEDTFNCTKDAVIIYDWVNGSYHEIARLCGREIPHVHNSTSTRMKVVFRTDSNINLDGFMAEWSEICGGTYSATDEEQFIFSPGYSNGYSPLLDCVYEISAPSNNNNIIVKFLDFALEGIYPDCKYDNISIYGQRDYEMLFKVYCGTHMPPILENYNKISVHFKTDRIGQDKGFKLSYSLYKCGGKITEPILIKSGSEDNYYDGMNCTWIIEAPSNKVVIVNFIYIDIESHSSCSNDYIAVFVGSKIENNDRLALLCGKINSSTVIKSNTSKAIVQFISDNFLNYRGFQAQITFSYGEAVGCGGVISLLTISQYLLKSPRIGNSYVYENYLDCHWFVKAPENHVIKAKFTAFHISSCENVNQTAIGISVCNCDFVEIRDGLNPDSLLINKYCGHTIPAEIVSSSNVLSIRLSTDGEVVSSGFEINLSIESSRCVQSQITVDYSVKKIRSPGYENGVIPRSLHCKYIIKESTSHASLHLRINSIDLQPGTNNDCNNDKLIITKYIPQTYNSTLGKNFILNRNSDNFFFHSVIFNPLLNLPEKFILCGANKSLDFYLLGDVSINLITTVESPTTHRGVEFEVSYLGYCGRNYTEPYGRIQNAYYNGQKDEQLSCSTLITAPENYTISIYINELFPNYYSRHALFEIFDGDKLSSPLLLKVESDYNSQSVFSTGRYLLLHSVFEDTDQTIYDLNYVITDKGRGCGGKLVNELGRITSPMYPETYRKRSTCEWELETPVGTRLLLHFSEFDMGVMCDQNYVSLVDKSGNYITSYCSDTPADFTSEDNYIKIVYVTTMSNGGTGWVIDFMGILND